MKLQNKEFYKLLVRPTVVVSTISKNGIPNAAPFSWNSPLSVKPRPLFGFSCNSKHDTWRNINENREFVVNLVDESFGPLMHILETKFPYEVDEIKKAGLNEEQSKTVNPPRIVEAYAWIECEMTNYLELSERNVWIVGKVLFVEAKDKSFTEVVDVEAVKPLNHIYGEYFVTKMKMSKFKRIH